MRPDDRQYSHIENILLNLNNREKTKNRIKKIENEGKENGKELKYSN